MAVEAQLYTENHGFSLGGGGGGYSPQDLLMMESLNLQQKQQQIQFIHQLQNMHQQNNPPENGFLIPENTPSLMVFNQSPAAAAAPPLMKKQRLDIDGLINFQSERLRWALQEQRKQQLALLLRKYESETQILFRQKDEEIAKAVNRRMELEDFLVKMETENQVWQRVAKENEVIIITLHNTIDQLRENAALGHNAADDAESCCDFAAKEKIGNLEQEEEEEGRRKVMICKSCNSRNSCVIFLPCRHLCCCQVCEAYIDSCPVCKMAKKGSIEALI